MVEEREGVVSVYVDDMRAAYMRMVMCHMIADSTDELFAMADRIGVARKWVQKPGTAREHFDISLTKRALAIRLGAIPITRRVLVLKLLERAKAEKPERGDG